MKRQHDFTALKKHFDIKIPKGWSWKYLHELGTFSKGKGITKEQLSSTGIPCIRYGEIYTTHNFVVKEFTSFISNEVAAESQKIKSGDILFAGSGETIEDIGKAVAYVGKIEAYAGGDVVILSTDSSVDPVYVSYALNSSIANRQKRRLGQGQQVVHIYPNDLSQIKILIPPISVQKDIVKSLLQWGVAISSIEKLIQQKEKYLQWLEGQLISGKKRIKKFGKSRWNEIHIREIAEEVSIRNKARNHLTVLSCTKYSGLVPSLEYFGRQIFSEDVSTYKIVPKNHFAYATNHIEEGSIGYQNKFDEALISPMYTVFKTNKKIDDSFLLRLLKSHRLIYEYNARMEGSIDRRGGLRWQAFAGIKTRIPELNEQIEISNTLSLFEKEIYLLKQKAAAIQKQKEGLMQKYLTGRNNIIS